MQFKTVAKVTIAALRYVRDDLTAKYGLETEARCVIRGPGIGVGNASAGPLTIESEKGGERVVLTAAPFPASSGEWGRTRRSSPKRPSSSKKEAPTFM